MTLRFPMILVLVGAVISVVTGRSHAPTPTGMPRDRPAALTEHQVLEQFAAAYVRLLDGRLEAQQLPDATTAVRALARQAGAVPGGERRGPLAVTNLRLATSGSHSYYLTARDTAHTFYAQLTLAHRGGRWLVVGLTPPDFVQALARPAPASPPATAGVADAGAAARRFLEGYLPWLYGQAPARWLAAAGGPLRASGKARRPRVPPTIHDLHPRVAAIGIQHRDDHWRALANISDGRDTYELDLSLGDHRGRWIVTNVSSPG